MRTRGKLELEVEALETKSTRHHSHGQNPTKQKLLGTGRSHSKTDYSQALYFDAESIAVPSIHSLWETLKRVSGYPHQCLIRGVPDWEFARWAVENPDAEYRRDRNGEPQYCRDLIRGPVEFPHIRNTRRRLNVFQEPESGTPWVMLDFDDLEIPKRIGNPDTLQAIEWTIENHLPEEFHGVTFVFQFSNSAGLLEPDGTPYRTGFNAHLFFVFDRGVTNVALKHWLEDFPVDGALFNAVQIHYTSNPTITGIKCVLEQRQGIVQKAQDVVQVPEVEPAREGDGQLELL